MTQVSHQQLESSAWDVYWAVLIAQQHLQGRWVCDYVAVLDPKQLYPEDRPVLAEPEKPDS